MHAGDPLVQLDDRDYRAAVAARRGGARASRAPTSALAEARAAARPRAVAASGVISRRSSTCCATRPRSARATRRAARGRARRRRASTSSTRLLRAPRDGVMLAKLKEVGEIAVPGRLRRLGRSHPDGQPRRHARRGRRQRGRPRPRAPRAGGARSCPTRIPSRAYAAQVVKLYPQVDRQKGTLKVEVQRPRAGRAPAARHERARHLPRRAGAAAGRGAADRRGAARRAAPRRPGRLLRLDRGRGARRARRRRDRGRQAATRRRVTSGLQGGEAVVVAGDPTHAGQRLRVESPS